MRNAILIGDALAWLKRLPSESVHCIMTSPPYFGLRDYGADGQIGLEATPEQYLEKLVAVFREARRVLREDGTCWVNMGDSYAGSTTKTTGRNDENPEDLQRRFERYGTGRPKASTGGNAPTQITVRHNLKPKDLMNMPHRFALAMQADGWWHRQTNVWHKPNPMPSSVTDRTTTDYEFVFHFAKAARYWYDQDAIREPFSYSGDVRIATAYTIDGLGRKPTRPYKFKLETAGRNKRATWTIAALNHGRDYLLIELNAAYAGLAQRRIKAHRQALQAADPMQPTVVDNGMTQLSLFGEASA